MAFFLTVLYLIDIYLTPVVLFGPLAEFRIGLILAAVILLISLPKLVGSFVFKTSQALALAGMSVAVFMSMLIGVHWLGGAMDEFMAFLPNIYAYFLLGIHCNSRKKFQILVLMLLGVSMFVIAKGAIELRYSIPVTGPPGGSQDEKALWEAEHPFLVAEQNAAGDWIYRLRGQAEIHDPNDFGQVLLCAIPLQFIFWRPKKFVRNFAFVILPVCVLLAGVFMTHSRGALVALVAVVLVAARRRIGTLPAAIVAGALLAGAMALSFTGGRAISASAGEDRTMLWGESLQLLKEYPLFGIGIAQLPGYLGHTAHNTIAVCAAELGLFGLFFFALYILPTVRDALQIASPLKVTDAGLEETSEGEFSLKPWKGTELDKAEINRFGFCMLLALTGFFATGWFLSRAYVMTLFLLGGMTEVVYQAALRRQMVPPRLTLGRVLAYSGVLAIGMVAVLYIMLRVVNVAR